MAFDATISTLTLLATEDKDVQGLLDAKKAARKTIQERLSAMRSLSSQLRHPRGR